MQRLAQTRAVYRLIEKAKKRWGLEEWTIEFKWGDIAHEGEIDPINFPLKKAVITIDRHTVKTHSKKYLEYLVTHEVGHALTYVMYRSVTDWLDHKDVLPKGSRERDIFEESYNTNENLMIDHIISRIMQLDVSIKSKN